MSRGSLAAAGPEGPCKTLKKTSKMSASSPTSMAHRTYVFGGFVLDPVERLLLHNGTRVPLTPKVFDLLLVLVESQGRLLSKDDLIRTLWPDSFVEEGGLTRCISVLRKALDDGNGGRAYIETVPKRGYRFVGAVTASDADA